MPKFSKAEFNGRMQEVRDYLVDACREKAIPLAKVARAGEMLAEQDPATYAINDGAKMAMQQFAALLAASGMTDKEAADFLDIFGAIQDVFGQFIASLAYNTYTPIIEISEPPPEWPEACEGWNGKPIELGFFDEANVLGDLDGDDSEVSRYRIVNPCMMTVTGPSGAAVDYALPGWSCVLAGVVVVAAAIGDGAGDFLDNVISGFEKTGREMKRFGRKVKKWLKKIF